MNHSRTVRHARTLGLCAALLAAQVSAQGPAAYVVDLGGSCGGGFPTLNSTPPVLSEDLTMFVTSAYPNSTITLFVQPPLPAPIPLPPDCTAWVDGNGFVFTGVTDANGNFNVTFNVDYIQIFTAGVRCDCQALIETTGPGSVNILGVQAVITNAIAIVMGYDPPGPPSDVPASGCEPCTKTRCQWTSCSGWSLLNCNFNTVFPNGLVAGVYNTSTGSCPPNGKKFTATSTGRNKLKSYLCDSSCGSGTFSNDTTNNDQSTGAGNLGRNIAALALNISFSDAGLLGCTEFGDLVYVKDGNALNGMTIREILAAANNAVAGLGFPAGFCASDLNCFIDNLNNSFKYCDMSCWAGSRLFRQRPPRLTFS